MRTLQKCKKVPSEPPSRRVRQADPGHEVEEEGLERETGAAAERAENGEGTEGGGKARIEECQRTIENMMPIGVAGR